MLKTVKVELIVEMVGAAWIQITPSAVLTLITTQIGAELLLMTAGKLILISFPRWLLTRRPCWLSPPEMLETVKVELIVEMARVAIIVTTLSAVLTLTGVELLRMTALLLPKSSPRWLPTIGSRSHPSLLKDVLEQSVMMVGAAMTVTTHSAALAGVIIV